MPEYYLIAREKEEKKYSFVSKCKTEEAPPHRDYVFSEEGAIVTQRELQEKGIEAIILRGALDTY